MGHFDFLVILLVILLSSVDGRFFGKLRSRALRQGIYPRDNVIEEDPDAIVEDPDLELCNECCNPGDYRHGNPKCGLAINSHNFAFDLMKSLTKGRERNIVISPFSVMNILMLLSLGTTGLTQEEIRRSLQFPLYFPPNQDHILMKCTLMKYDGVSLRAANAIFYDSDKADHQDSFIERAARFYNVTVKGVTFASDPFHAWMDVAEFIKESTNGFLEQVLQDSYISEVLFVNTVYFNGTWNFKVPSDSQKKIAFNRNFRSVGKVDAFSVTSDFNVGVLENYAWYGDRIRVVELPYSDPQFSMFIFKSEEGLLSLNFIEETIKRWTVGVIKNYKMEQSRVSLTIPKFSITFQTDVSAALEEMGITRLFGRGNRAEMGNLFSNDPDLSADSLLHTAKITVSEAGTEAAAASWASIFRSYEHPTTITFNHPFVFLIYDSCNNLILFQGRCVDPKV